MSPTPGTLTRTYRLVGLDRVLYAAPPTWPDATFEQSLSSAGDLILRAHGIATREDLDAAIVLLDERAQRFRLAISLATGVPLSLSLKDSQEPDVDSPGMLRAHARVAVSAEVSPTVAPGTPPPVLPQQPLWSERWIHTVAETYKLGEFQDESLKRFYLIIEELWPGYASRATPAECDQVKQLKYVRDFVSHPICHNQDLCRFIAAQLPSAVIATPPPPAVRFDRTSLEHRNFVGRLEPSARAIARLLIDDAIARGP